MLRAPIAWLLRQREACCRFWHRHGKKTQAYDVTTGFHITTKR